MDLTELKGLPLIKAKPVYIDFELTDENIENYRETFDDESVVIVHVDETAYSIIGGDLCDVLYDVRDILAEEEYDDYSITYYVDVETKNFDGDELNLLAAAAEAYGSVDDRAADDEEKSAVCFDGDVCFIMENNCYDEEISQEDFDTLWKESVSDNVNEDIARAKYEIKDGVGIIPEGTKNIVESAFCDCMSLTSIVIPDSVREIGVAAFENCKGLTSIVIPNSVTVIRNHAFKGCTSLKSIVIPKSVTEIGRCAFLGCTSLASIVIPESVTKIEENTFNDCTGLTNIVIPNSVTVIGYSAFYGCTSLTSIIIPDSATKIDTSAFNGCTSLESIVIPDSVTEIGGNAFEGCTSLKGIVIPKSVTEIGGCAFKGCTCLTSIVVSEDNKIYDSRTSCNAIIETKTNIILAGCIATIIPDSVTEIGKRAFEGCTSLTGIVIPKSVTEIGEHAFESCTGLTNINIPDSLTKIGYSAFKGCTGLTSIEVSEGNKIYDSRNNCNAIIETKTNKIVMGCIATTIPDSVTEIGESAFCDCMGLTSIVIPDSVTEIGSCAFCGCENLKSLSIMGPVTKLQDDVFWRCTSLETVSFGTGIKKIVKEAFDDCTALKAINVPAKKADYYKKRLPESLHNLIVELPVEKKK